MILRAVVLLALDHTRRLLREGIVLRSLLFPVALALLTVGATIAYVGFTRPPDGVALGPGAQDPDLVAELEADGWRPLLVADAEEAVRSGLAALGTDGTTLWLPPNTSPPPAMEAIVRRHLGTVWRPHDPRAVRAVRIRETDAPWRLAAFIGALFALYGVVFGAGAVARDRDEGTLDAELALPVPHVVHGLSRWLAGTAVLGGFFALSVWLLHATMGVGAAGTLALHGLAAAGGSTAIGLLVVGRAGLDRGFAAPMSAGLVVILGLLGAGVAGSGPARLLPVASLFAHGQSPALPLGIALGAGALAALAFARRTAVQ